MLCLTVWVYTTGEVSEDCDIPGIEKEIVNMLISSKIITCFVVWGLKSTGILYVIIAHYRTMGEKSITMIIIS